MTGQVTQNLPLLAGAPNGIAKLRELIQELAIRGKLVSQDAGDESASELLAQIAAEKSSLSKPTKPLGSVSAAEQRHAVPHGWAWARLGSLVLESGAGWSPSCEPRPREGSEWGVLKVSAVSWAAYQPEENKALPANLEPRPEHEVQPGDFLVSRANTAELVARSVVVDSAPPRLMLSDKIVRLKLSQSCNRRFVNLANSCPDARRYYGAVAGGTSGSMKNVTREQILNLPVPLPPLSEQHRIVATVDELMALCDRLEAEQADAEAAHAQLVQALLASLTRARDAADFRASWQQLSEHFHTLFTTEASVDALKQTVLQLGVTGKLVPQEPASSTFDGIPSGWGSLRIEEFCTVQGGIQKTPLRRPVSQHFPYLRVANVQRGRIDCRELERYELTLDELERWRLMPGDLLVVEGNGSENEIGRCAVWRGEVEDCVYQNHLMRVRPEDSQQISYLLMYLNSPVGTAHMRRLAITTSGLFNLSVGKIRSIPVALPPLAEQRQIVAKADELLALCDQLKLSLTRARKHHEQLASVLVEQAVA